MNIHAIGTEQTGDSDKCCTNMHTVQEDEPSRKHSELRMLHKHGQHFKI